LNGDFSGADQTAGALAAASTLPTVDRRLRSVSSVAARIEYTSTSGITEGRTRVSGSVFAPKGQAPKEGWPILAYGHGTTGIKTNCAPSLSPTLDGSSLIVAALVKAGYVVVIPDYQGLGVDGTYHPYLDATTVGYNMIDAVRAVRKLVPQTSTQWLALGLSQGAQASWAANELAANYAGGLQLVGSVSLSPPTDLIGFADAAAGGRLTREQRPAYQLILASLKNIHPEINLDDYRRGVVAEKWDVLSECKEPEATERRSVADQITADDLRPATPEAVATIKGYLQGMGLPQGPAAAPMLVIYGGQDALTPPAWTEGALRSACGLGDIIDIQFQPDRGHAAIDISMTYDWIQDRFKGVPAPNSCESFTAAPVRVG
jgi:pimeloyl-ACP methyl ester carboxylesterase